MGKKKTLVAILCFIVVFVITLYDSPSIIHAKQQRWLELTRENVGSDNTTATFMISDRVLSIDNGALSGLTNLKEIIVDENNPLFASYEGILYTKDYSEIVCIPPKMGIDNIIPMDCADSYWTHCADGYTVQEADIIFDDIFDVCEFEQETYDKNPNKTINGNDFSKYVYIDEDGTVCFRYTGRGDKRIIVPDGVQCIKGFVDLYRDFNFDIEYVYIPNSVRSMCMYMTFYEFDEDEEWYNCLYQCVNLKKVEYEYDKEDYAGFKTNKKGTRLYFQLGNITVWSRKERHAYDENEYLPYTKDYNEKKGKK